MGYRNTYCIRIEGWTEDELNAEIDGFSQLGGVGVSDIIRKNEAEDELAWRNENGYGGMTPKEIEDDLFEQGKIDERYIT
jgi:hypothetical protein